MCKLARSWSLKVGRHGYTSFRDDFVQTASKSKLLLQASCREIFLVFVPLMMKLYNLGSIFLIFFCMFFFNFGFWRYTIVSWFTSYEIIMCILVIKISDTASVMSLPVMNLSKAIRLISPVFESRHMCTMTPLQKKICRETLSFHVQYTIRLCFKTFSNFLIAFLSFFVILPSELYCWSLRWANSRFPSIWVWLALETFRFSAYLEELEKNVRCDLKWFYILNKKIYLYTPKSSASMVTSSRVVGKFNSLYNVNITLISSNSELLNSESNIKTFNELEYQQFLWKILFYLMKIGKQTEYMKLYVSVRWSYNYT